MQIIDLFPTALARFGLDRDITEQEMSVVKSQETVWNGGNSISTNTNILNELPELKTWIEERLTEYVSFIECPADGLGIRITQSWLNYTNTGEHHHPHNHSNSIVSGVFYFSGQGEPDKITFHKSENNQIKVDRSHFNYYNSSTWWVPAVSKELLLFPSTLRHEVTETSSDQQRISLAFNTFWTGALGNPDRLTQLIL
jgi:uncharacterized protein (TIGR02466 family)